MNRLSSSSRNTCEIATSRTVKSIRQPARSAYGSWNGARRTAKGWIQFPVEISLSAVQTRTGHVAVSFITDISSRRAAEMEREKLIGKLAEERSRLGAVLDQMPVGVVIVEPTRLQIVLHNQEAERLLKHEVVIPVRRLRLALSMPMAGQCLPRNFLSRVL